MSEFSDFTTGLISIPADMLQSSVDLLMDEFRGNGGFADWFRDAMIPFAMEEPQYFR